MRRLATAATALFLAACCAKKAPSGTAMSRPTTATATATPIPTTTTPPEPIVPKVCGAFGRPTSMPGWPCSESSGCHCGWVRKIGERPTRGLQNTIAFHAEGAEDGAVSEAWVSATVMQVSEAEEAHWELAADAMRLSAGVGMGSIPEPADKAIRAGKAAKGTNTGTGQTWSVERRSRPADDGYQLIYRVKRPA